MKKMIKSAALAAFALFALCTMPRAQDLKYSSFLPPNNMKIPVGDVRAKGIDQAGFNTVMDKIQAVYGPIIAAHGGNLVINRLWDDETVNASAEQQGDQWIINMYGGLARHPAVTQDGMMLVACHELGHHLGGFPLIGGAGWASNEGGADYFAALKCLRLTLGDSAPGNTDPTAKAGCAAVYPAGADRNHCEASVMAGVSVSTLLAELGGSPTPTLTTPDASVVDQTNDEHPAAQCRLDTYYQAALCAKPVGQDVSRSDPFGGCTAKEGYKVGMRPRCWYAPAAGSEIESEVAKAHVSGSEVKTVQTQIESLRAALLSNDL